MESQVGKLMLSCYSNGLKEEVSWCTSAASCSAPLVRPKRRKLASVVIEETYKGCKGKQITNENVLGND